MKDLRTNLTRYSPRQGTSTYHNHARIPLLLFSAILFAPLPVVARLARLHVTRSGLNWIVLQPDMTPLQLAVIFELTRRRRAKAVAKDISLRGIFASLVFLWGTNDEGILRCHPLPEGAVPAGRCVLDPPVADDHVHQFVQCDWNMTFGLQSEPAGLAAMNRQRFNALRRKSGKLVDTAYYRRILGCARCPMTVVEQNLAHA